MDSFLLGASRLVAEISIETNGSAWALETLSYLPEINEIFAPALRLRFLASQEALEWSCDHQTQELVRTKAAFDLSGGLGGRAAHPASSTGACGRSVDAQCLRSGVTRIAAASNREPRGLTVPKCSEIREGEACPMTTFVESEGVVARLGRLERPTSGSGVQVSPLQLIEFVRICCGEGRGSAGYQGGFCSQFVHDFQRV